MRKVKRRQHGEPWEWNAEQRAVWTTGGDPRTIMGRHIAIDKSMVDKELHEDAHRAAACVNALDGIGFDDVDAVREFIMAFDSYSVCSVSNNERWQHLCNTRRRIHLDK